MTVHMIRVVAENPSDIDETQANRLVDQWLADNTPWTEDPVPHEITLVEKSDLTDRPRHFRGDVRFEFSDDKRDLLTQIETDLSAIASWYRIGYHECGHDERDGRACSWDEQRESGAVPSKMPEFV